MIVIAPVLAAMVHATASKAGPDFETVDWQDALTAQNNLFIAGHRDSLRRVVELLGPGGTALDLYRLL